MKKLDASKKVQQAIALVIVTITLLAMTPIVVDQVQAINTSNWTFTGHEGAEALLGLIPFVWVGGVLISAVIGAFAIAKSDSKTAMLKREYIATLPKSPLISKAINRIALIRARFYC